MPLSTLAVAKRMIDAGFTPKQAEAQAEIWADIVETDLATKRDLKEVESGLKRDLKEVDASLKRDLRDVEASLKRDIKDIDLKIANVEANLRRDIKELELKMDTWRESQSRLALQMSIGTAVLVTTLVGFMIRFMGR